MKYLYIDSYWWNGLSGKGYIPVSQTVTFPANASFFQVIQKSREIFFPDEADKSDAHFTLADSGGVPYEVKNKSDWIL